MRDEKYLHTEKFPFASFKLSGVPQADKNAISAGEIVDVTFTGEFTLHGVTKNVTITGKAGFYNEVKELIEYGYPREMFNFDGKFTIKLSDFDIKRPQFLVMKLAEEQFIDINFTATTGRGK